MAEFAASGYRFLHVFRMTRPIVLFLLLTAAIYGRAVTYPFVTWDDEVQVQSNPRVMETATHPWKEIFDPRDSLAGKRTEYAPIREVVYRLARSVLGPSPAVFHTLSIILHLCAALSLFVFLRRLPLDPKLVWLGSLVFLVHPLQVEAAAWISGMKESLSAMFMFLALWVELRWRQKPIWAAAASLGLLALALGSKATSVIWLPLAVCTWLYFERPLDKRRFVYWIPHLFLIAGSTWLTLRVAHANDVVKTFLEDAPASTFFTMVRVVALYVMKFWVPWNLSAHYKPIPIVSPMDLSFLLNLMALAAVVASVFVFRKRITLLPFGLAWFVVALLPTLNLVPISIQMADRYTYVGIVGFGLVLGQILTEKVHPPRVALWLAAVVLAAYASVAFVRVGVWQDSRTLWEDAARKAPQDGIAWNNFGAALMEEGRLEEAEAAFLRLSQKKAKAWNNLGRVRLLRYRRTPDPRLLALAEEDERRALRIKPDYALALNNLGLVLWERGLRERRRTTLEEALKAFDSAQISDPAYGPAGRNKKALEAQLKVFPK